MSRPSGKVLVGMGLLGFFVLVAVVGPLIAPYDPSATSPETLQPPSPAHLLGTTQTGQDVLSELLVAARTTLLVGGVAGAVATALAVLVGVTAGYLGGLEDELLSALSNVFLVIPALPLVIVLAGYLRGAGPLSVALVISVTGWAFGARVLRAQTLSLRERDFVKAAPARGEGTARIVLVEILPNELAVIVSGFLLITIFAILTEASLAFLGIGSVSSWSWGSMLYWAQNAEAFTIGAWWWYVPPGLCIALVATSLGLLNFGIDERLNPRLRAVGDSKRPPRIEVTARAEPARLGPEVVLAVSGLRVEYGSDPTAVQAVQGVDLELRRGELLGLAGESGCGKTTLALALAGLVSPPGRVTAGRILFHSAGGAETAETVDVLGLSGEALRHFRWRRLSVVPQGSLSSLNPLLRIRAQLVDTIRAHDRSVGRRQLERRAAELLDQVGVDRRWLDAYPHELSGGMRQRVMLAMALALDPDVVVMDEPTTALDVVVQREILDQITTLRRRLGFAVLFITHDLSLLLEIADTILVIYAGRIVERAPAEEVARRPAHPYTAGLLHSFPSLHGPRRVLDGIPGMPPDLRRITPGCPFRSR